MLRVAVAASCVVAVAVSADIARAQTIAAWSFNSVPADSNPSTGTNTASAGSGSIVTLGPLATGFLAGCPADPADSGGDNSAMWVSTFPIQGTASGTRGVRVNASTLSQSGVTISYQQRNTTAASAWWRFEYTLDGGVWDVAGLASSGGDPGEYRFPAASAGLWTEYVWDLSSIAGIPGNAAFAFRVTAIHAPLAPGYIATGNGSPNGYNPTGTVSFDLVNVSGSAPQQAICCRGSLCQLVAGSCTGPNTLSIPVGTTCNASGAYKTPCCKADYNHQGGLTVQDIFDYLGAWFGKDITADINGATPSVAGVTVQDIFDFLGAWFARGCG